MVNSLLDCPSNLKEAIDWILRVTGKDGGQGGGGGTAAITELSKQVKRLLEEVKGFDTKQSVEIGKVIQALDTSSGELITPLSERLRDFIGYGSQDGKGGIALVLEPVHRLKDGLLMFWVGMFPNLLSLVENSGIGNTLSGALSKIVEFDEVVKVVKGLRSRKGKDVSDVFEKLNHVEGLDNTQKGVTQYAPVVSKYLGSVLGAVNGVIKNAFSKLNDSNLKQKLPALSQKFNSLDSQVDSLKNGLITLVTNYEKGENIIKSNIEKVKSSLATLNETANYGVLANEINEAFSKIYPQRDQRNAENIKAAFALLDANSIISAVCSGISGFLSPLQKKGYKSAYHGYTWNDEGTGVGINTASSYQQKVEVCTKIFMGCIPFVFSMLSYLYWQCRDGGEWGEQQLGGGGSVGGLDLLYHMSSLGYHSSYLNGHMKGSKVKGIMEKKFQDLQTGIAGRQTSYPDFFSEIHKKIAEPATLLQSRNVNSLSILYYAASLYFKAVQDRQYNDLSVKPSQPTTIRDMLYWVSGLQYSPNYESLRSNITSLFQSILNKPNKADASLALDVAISSSDGSKDTVAPASLKNHITNLCLSAPVVLGFIQGSGESEKSGEPWLHYLFSNGSQFTYRSGASLLNDFCEYMYAIQFQLTFLSQQCSGIYSISCGWKHCRFGTDIEPTSPDGQMVPSHICKGFNCPGKEPWRCNHIGNPGRNCNHNQGGLGCGTGANFSPLQAFLTDHLKGFSIPKTPTPNSRTHLDNHTPGLMCHVKMGFHGHLRAKPSVGVGLSHALEQFCGGYTSPVRQLCETLNCLTKRTPRTLGDLFGFYWHLTGQMFNTTQLKEHLQDALKLYDSDVMNTQPMKHFLKGLSSIQNKSLFFQSLENLTDQIPFWDALDDCGIAGVLACSLYGLASHCHKRYGQSINHNPKCYSPSPTSSKPDQVDDLSSLCGCNGKPQNSDFNNGMCGKYFSPLVYSTGSTFIPKYSSTYLSWIVYLSSEFYEALRELQKHFESIECTHCGTNCKGIASCHAIPNARCQCDSVVTCSSVFPLLYSCGLTFNDAAALNGWKYYEGWKANSDTKRNCAKFSRQISAVLAENAPLHNLLLAIDEFMYYVRFRFMSLISVLWICSFLIFLYFILHSIDLLHVKSHVHFPSSHSIPPVTLLTTSKAPSLTKFTKLAYFMP
ncbi:variant erythrocyte surface antigen-1 family protein [Babesia caballi]|uniref:Variant erythrocyte surface antigen-1 family protein n=1 Tax=Babesia caballi TaxID=5871 RepID=A0AAV4LVF8_BABCB|nr:variant erythrocyte surface antigen-1 family protein [Babesia caballi]